MASHSAAHVTWRGRETSSVNVRAGKPRIQTFPVTCYPASDSYITLRGFSFFIDNAGIVFFVLRVELQLV